MKIAILLLSLASLSAAKPLADAEAYAPVYGYYANPLAVAPAATQQFHSQDEIGQYNYGYSDQNSVKNEFKTADGVVRGAYSYIDANGVLQTTNYISDALGFRVAATNLPVAPVAEVAVAKQDNTNADGSESVPGAVQDGDATPAITVPVTFTAETKTVQVAAPANPVIVPYVSYANLPYATSYPYYINQVQGSAYAVQPAATPYVVQADATPYVAQAAATPYAVQAVATPYVVQAAATPYVVQAAATPYVVEAVPAEVQKEATAEQTVNVVPEVYTVPEAAQQAAVATQVVEAAQPEIIKVPILTQYHSQDELGQYQFGYSDASATRSEIKSSDGVVSGSYNYVDADGKIQTVNYIADALGFRAVGTNIPVASGELPVAVEDTPEVVAAREEHLRLVAEARANEPDEITTEDPEAEAEGVAVAVTQPVVPQVVAQEAQTYVAAQPIYEQPTFAYVPAQQIVQQQAYAIAQPVVQQQAYAIAQPVVQQQAYAIAQPVIQQQAYAVAQPVTQQVAEQQTYTIAQPVVQQQAYAVAQPVVQQTYVAQPYVTGQAVAVSQPVAVAQAAVAQSANQFHAQDEIGQYQYGYANEHSFKSEQRTADGIVRGSYSYIDANGIVQQVDYISDAFGFRVAATNLPRAPIPDAVPAAAEEQPAPVEDEKPVVVVTPEAPGAEAAPVPVPGGKTYNTAIEALAAIIEAKEAAEQQAPVEDEKPAVTPEAPVAEAVPVPNQFAVPYNYILPGYTANYAPVYQPYASTYGYYVQPIAVGPGAATHSQYHAQDEVGQYSYGYSTADSAKSEVKTADGIVRGSYSYVDANGVLQTTNYVSDEWGFKAAATNLPVAVAPATN